jgi:MFS family permease
VPLPRRLAQPLGAFAEMFGNAELRNLQLAGVGSTLGIGAYSVATAVFAYDAGGAKAVGLLYFVRWSLAGAFAPWLALLADRISRRRVMLAADLVRAGLVGSMAAVAAAHGPILLVYGLAVVASIAGAAFYPAQAALLPSLVRTPEELAASNVALSTTSSVGMVAGPALGGALLAVSSPWVVFVVTAAAFLWSAACLARIPADSPAPPEGEAEKVLPALLGGFRAIASEPKLRVVIGLSGGQTLVFGALEVLLVIVALRLLHAGNAGVGWLNAAMGVGGLLGAVAATALVGRKRLAGDLGVGLLLFGFPLALTAAWTNTAFTVVLFAAIGIGNTIVDVSSITLMQRTAEGEVLARVFGVLESLIFVTLAVGALVTPALVAAIGPRPALLVAGVLLPAVLVPLWPRLAAIDASTRVPSAPLELLRAIPLFAQLPPPVLERLAASAAEVTAPPGAAVVEQGAPGDLFYVVSSGRAAVEIDGARSAELGPGDFFGEIALLRDVPRTATVRALDELRLYALGRDVFVAAVTGHAQSREAAESVVAARLPLGVPL